jgi:hypothetical protein
MWRLALFITNLTSFSETVNYFPSKVTIEIVRRKIQLVN